MDISEIQHLIRYVSSKQNISEVKIQKDEFSLTIKTSNTVPKTIVKNTVPQIQELEVVSNVQNNQTKKTEPKPKEQPKEEKKELKDTSKFITIKSQMIGTFYRKPKPESPNFVNVGDEIKPGTTLCIIEAMKLFNEIESEVSGKVVEILVKDNTPIEFDQPLFLVDPS